MDHKCKQCGTADTQRFRTHPHTGKLRNFCRVCERHRVAEEDEATASPTAMLSTYEKDAELRSLKKEKKALLDELSQARKRQEVLTGLSRFSAPPIQHRKISDGRREATAVVLCSDWHVEEPVEPKKVNGMNEYDLDIAAQRIQNVADGILWLLEMHKTKFEINDLILWLGGDLFSGYIHEELTESNSLSPVESILWLQERIVGLIDRLLVQTGLNKIYVPCSWGNHSRTTQKIRVSTGAENSYEWMMYQQLALWYKDEPRIEVIAPPSQLIYMRVYDYVIRFAHGDAINYGGGVGGIMISLNKAIDSWNVGQRADITCIGHFHQYLSLPYAVTNGSLIGYNPYSVRIKAKYEPPQQSFFLIDSRHGKCCATPIWVGKSEELEEVKRASRKK